MVSHKRKGRRHLECFFINDDGFRPKWDESADALPMAAGWDRQNGEILSMAPLCAQKCRSCLDGSSCDAR
jgi:hypothetical protein